MLPRVALEYGQSWCARLIEVLEPQLRTFARREPHVFAGTAQPL
jgi:hypothetical protein